MRRLVLTLVLCAGSAWAADVRYGAGLKTEARVRTPLPGDQGQHVTGDLEVDPVLDVLLLTTRTSLGLQYAPQLIWREPQTGGRLLPLQRGRVSLGVAVPRLTVSLIELASWGLADIGALRSDDTLPPGSVAPVQTLGGVPFVSSATTAALDARLSRFVSLSLTAGYAISGSPEDGTQLTSAMPLQYGPQGAVRVRVAASRLDALTTAITFNQATFITGQQQLVGVLSETWDRQLTRQWSFSASGGLGLSREVVVTGVAGIYTELLPVAGLSTGYAGRWAQVPWSLSASVRMAPFGDRFTGAVYERLEARAQGSLRPARNVTVAVAASGAQAVSIGRNEQPGDSLVSGEGGVTWAATPWMVLQGSFRVLWTAQPSLGVPGQVQAAGAVSVTVRQQGTAAW